MARLACGRYHRFSFCSGSCCLSMVAATTVLSNEDHIRSMPRGCRLLLRTGNATTSLLPSSAGHCGAPPAAALPTAASAVSSPLNVTPVPGGATPALALGGVSARGRLPPERGSCMPTAQKPVWASRRAEPSRSADRRQAREVGPRPTQARADQASPIGGGMCTDASWGPDLHARHHTRTLRAPARKARAKP